MTTKVRHAHSDCSFVSYVPSTEGDIETVFATLNQFGVEALVIGPDNFFNTRNQQLATLSLRYRVPAIFNDLAFAAAGGLIAYGASINEQYRLVGLYVGLELL